MLIADVSIVLAWLYEESQTSQALDVLPLIETNGLLVPALWWTELENGLVIGERRARNTTDQSAAFLEIVRSLPIRTDDMPPHQTCDRILAIARQHQLTAYDATYVELAVRESAALATFDTAIRRCAPQLGLSILPDAA